MYSLYHRAFLSVKLTHLKSHLIIRISKDQAIDGKREINGMPNVTYTILLFLFLFFSRVLCLFTRQTTIKTHDTTPPFRDNFDDFQGKRIAD